MKKAPGWGGLRSLRISFKKEQDRKREGAWILGFPQPPGVQVIENVRICWAGARVAAGKLPSRLTRMASPFQREGVPSSPPTPTPPLPTSLISESKLLSD